MRVLLEVMLKGALVSSHMPWVLKSRDTHGEGGRADNETLRFGVDGGDRVGGGVEGVQP